MPSILSGYEYDIFISYRQNDNKKDAWVTDFVHSLQNELDATLKEKVSIYFDQNLHDGLLETHDVDQSLNEKVKCLVFIPIVSQTYCDPNSFAWKKEFLPFLDFARQDTYGLDVKLANGNVTKRILPIRIHNIDQNDCVLFEKEIQGVMRPIDFIFKSQGVNRPLVPNDLRELNLHKTFYRDQMNKVANTIKDMIFALTHFKEIQEGTLPDIDINSNDLLVTEEVHIEAIQEQPRKTSSQKNIGWLKLFSAIVLSSVITGFIFWQIVSNGQPVENNTSLKLSILPPEGSQIVLVGEATVGVGRRVIDISNSGDRVVYIGSHKERPHIYIRDLDNFNSKLIPNTAGAYACRLSPDGNEVAYFVGNSLYKLKIEGGSPVKLAEIANPMDIIWHNESTLYFSADEGDILYKFEQGKEKKVIDSFEIPLRFNSIATIPDNSHILISSSSKIGLFNPSTKEVIDLNLHGNSPRFVFPNRIIFARKSALYVSEIDLESKKMISEPRELFTGIRTEVYGSAQYCISENGTLIYVSGEDTRIGEFTWVNNNGNIETLDFSKENYGAFKLSADQSKIAAPIYGTTNDIWILDLETNKKTRVTNSGSNHRPLWYNENALFINRDKSTYLINSTKVVNPELILENSFPQSVSANGELLVVSRNSDLYTYEMNTKKLNRITVTPSIMEFHGSISPDGSLIAYTRNDYRAFHVYLQKTNNGSEFIQISIREGSEEPRWTADGQSIIYRSGQQWMKVDIIDADKLEVSQPKLIFEGDYVNIGGFSFDVSNDGDRYLLVKGTPYKTASEIKVIKDWFSSIN